MKKYYILALGLILSPFFVKAAGSLLPMFSGGTGNASFASSTIPISNGTNLYGVATSSLGIVSGINTLTGDISASGSGSVAATLATVNSNTGSFGGSTAIPVITANGKGLVTALSTAAVIAPAGTLSGATLNSGVTASSLTSVGTLVNLTVTNAPTFSAMTAGSVLFAGTSGILSQDNANFNWNATTKQVGIGSTTPYAELSLGAPAGIAPYFSVGSSTGEVMKVTASTTANVGIGTTASFPLDILTSATTSIRIDSNGSKGGCIILKDSDGTGYTYITASNGTLSASTNVCT